MAAVVEGTGVLLLLSIFFAYILAPALPPVRRRVRIGRRRRPVSDGAAILLIYALVAVPGVVTWRAVKPAVQHWVAVTAPLSVERLLAGTKSEVIARVLAHVPLPLSARGYLVRSSGWAAGSLERSARATLDELIEAARFARWLIVVPALAFLLLAGAPAFQRSALRVLPRGHVQWRFEEYLRDVNSALAGYVRAQSAAALIVGSACVTGFLLLGTSSPVALGVLAGILELIPAIGPLTVLLIATAQADRVLGVCLFLLALRIVQDYVVYPRLIRRGMHLSTVAVIVTVWLGAVIARAPGVILAIPLAGFLSVSMRHWREYRDIETLIKSASTDGGRFAFLSHMANERPNDTNRALQKDPDDWKTGDEPMTAAQRSYIETLAQDTGEEVDENLTKAEASKLIDELREKSPRVRDN
jgi:predicted PurR-regulated permease PerM